jgi:hypothetical protein
VSETSALSLFEKLRSVQAVIVRIFLMGKVVSLLVVPVYLAKETMNIVTFASLLAE